MTSNDLARLRSDAASVTDIAAVGPLRPALLARYLDLTGLRHDYPLVLLDDLDRPVTTLTQVVDDLLGDVAPRGAPGERQRQHVLRLEAAIRRLLDREPGQPRLFEAWHRAAEVLLAESSDADALGTSLRTARDALRADGVLVPCDGHAPVTVVRHLRDVVERPRAASFRDELAELVRRLVALLAVDERRSEAGRAPERLRSSVGATHQDDFDFEAWSQLLASRRDDTPLPGPRRARIEWSLGVLRGQRFVHDAAHGGAGEAHDFQFDSCERGLEAHRERMPELVRLVKATAIARLELDNAYVPATHDGVFHAFDAASLWPEDLRGFPGHFVVLDGDELDHATVGRVLELLASPMPFTVLVVTSDPVGAPNRYDFASPRRTTGVELARAAVGLGTARVVQVTVAGLVRAVPAIAAALDDNGPALISVVTAAGAALDLPTYLAAAAAEEARAVPVFEHDPHGGAAWADRVSVRHTPRPTADWPVHDLSYEDERLQRVREDVAFTLADLVAADARFADHVAVVPRRLWSDAMVPVAAYVGMEPSQREGRLPYVLGVGQDDVLRRVVVDRHVVELTEQRLAAWRRLKELAGTRESDARVSTIASPPSPASADEAPADEEGEGAVGAVAAAEAAPTIPEDHGRESTESWIETARCTTCDECTNLNPRMFAYNEDKQAYIADRQAGTFRDLVTAAESCQVSIIHPGEPTDPDEPGLDELRRRAAAFA